MEKKLTSLVLFIALVYVVSLAYLGFLHDAKLTSQSRLDDVEYAFDRQVRFVGKETGLLLQSIGSEISRLANAISGTATTSKAEPQTNTRRHSKKADSQSDATPG